MRTFPGDRHKAVAAASVVVAIVLLLGSCTIQLAPSYNQSIVDGLNKANTDAQTLFAGVSNGVTSTTFATRQAQYNSVIGEFSAVESQLEARPMPPPPTNLFSGSAALPPTDPKAIPLLSAAPSINAVKHLVVTLTTMRDTDAQAGLPPSTASACVAGAPNPTACLFINSYRADLNDALTYEMALQR